MRLTDVIHTLSGEDVLKWDEVIALPIGGFLYRWNYLIEKAKKTQRELNKNRTY